MANVFILAIHIIFIAVVIVKKYKSGSPGDAAINALLILILFSVGWSLISLVTNNFLEPEWFSKDFDRSSVSLSILTIAEFFFYKSFYADIFGRKE